MSTSCKHKEFDATVDVNRLEDTERFCTDVRITCRQCQMPFRFIGLPAGLYLNGAATSVDATEARLAIVPKGEVGTVLDRTDVVGFSVRCVE
jgi:hypothetical protein